MTGQVRMPKKVKALFKVDPRTKQNGDPYNMLQIRALTKENDQVLIHEVYLNDPLTQVFSYFGRDKDLKGSIVLDPRVKKNGEEYSMLLLQLDVKEQKDLLIHEVFTNPVLQSTVSNLAS